MGRGGVSRAQVDTTVAAAQALEQPDFVIAGAGVGLPPPTVSNGSTLAGRMFINYARVGRAVPVTKMTYIIGTAAGNVDMGIYTGNAGRTLFTLVASSGSVVAAVGGGGYQTVTLSAPFTLQPGVDYWFALWTSSASLTLARGAGFSASTLNYRAWYRDLGGTALPATMDGTVAGLACGGLDMQAW